MLVATRTPARGGPRLLGAQRPPWPAGVAAAALAVAAATLLLYPLKHIAPAVSLGVVYLVVVLVISTWWGLALGLLTSVASALAFNLFHLPPTGRLTIADDRDVVALLAFLVVAVFASAVAEVARQRAVEAEARRQEADLIAELARGLIAGGDLDALLATTARRVALALGVDAAALRRGAVEGGPRQAAFPLRQEGTQVATLLLPATIDAALRARLVEHVVPSLEALMAAALQRDALQAEVVETAALRQSDVVKTAILRSVSHDLRTPLTSIVASGEALRSGRLDPEDREALAAGVVHEGERLARLIDNLLDLSRLEAGQAQPRPDWCALDEVLHAAGEGVGGDGALRDRRRPPVRARRRRAARARVREPHRQRRRPRRRRAGVRARQARRPARARARRRPRAGDPARRARPRLRAVLAGQGDAGDPGSAWRSCAASSRPTAGGCGPSRCPARARASWSSCRSRTPRRERRPPDPRLRRRAADPARAPGDPARRGLRRGRGGDRRRRRSTAPRCAPPDAAIVDLVLPDGDGVELCRAPARLERHADHRPQRRGRRGRQGRARWRPAPTTTSPSRSGRASSSRACRPRCAASARRPRRARDRADGLELDLARARSCARRRGRPPHPDRVRPAARADRATAGGC